MRWGPALFVNWSSTLKRLRGLEVLPWPLVKLCCLLRSPTNTSWTSMWQRLPLKQRELTTVWIPLNPFVFLPFSPPACAVCFYFVLFIFIPVPPSSLLSLFLNIPQCISPGNCQADVFALLNHVRSAAELLVRKANSDFKTEVGE